MDQLPPVLLVFFLASLTALATGLGALPFLFLKQVSPRATAYANALAAGLMLGATFGLIAEGATQGIWQTLIGANVGVLCVLGTSKALEGRDLQFGSLTGFGARKVILVVLVMTIHSVSEGVAVGAAFSGGARLASFIIIAIAVHNIPEGVAISAVLRPRGISVMKCAGWSVFSSLPQPLMAIPAFLFVEAFQPALPFALGFAAGAMVLMVLYELLPEAYQSGRRTAVGMMVTLTLFAMVLFQKYI